MQGLLNQELSYYPVIGQDKFKRKTYSQGVSIPCRFVEKRKLYTNNQGKNVEIMGKFQIMQPKLQNGTLIKFNGVNYEVEDSRDWVDESGEIFGSINYVVNSTLSYD